MDQIAAMLGRAGHALLLDCRAGTAEPVPFSPAAAGLTLLIIDTRIRHALGDGRYAERRRVCEEGASVIGELLTTSHDSLRDQFGMSWPQADEAVAAAVAAGAAGARMTGGGFGGCAVALVPADRAGQVRNAVTERFAQRHWPAPRYFDGVPSDGGRRLR
jgi:galactokinase